MKKWFIVHMKLLAVMSLLCLQGAVMAQAEPEPEQEPETEIGSASIELNTLDDVSGEIVSGVVFVSPGEQTQTSGVTLSIDNKVVTDWSASEPAWNSSSVSDGWHTFKLTEGQKTSECRLLVLNSSNIVIHTGKLLKNETWKGNVTHIICGTVIVPMGGTLTVSTDAVVKFCPQSKLEVEGRLNAMEAVFTALADDNYGGDTERDGKKSKVDYFSYDVIGNGNVNLSSAYWCNGEENVKGWTVETDLPKKMIVNAVVTQPNGTELNAVGSRLAFFDKTGRCYGSAPVYTSSYGTRIFTVQLYSENIKESELVAKLWNAATGEVVDIKTTINFKPDSTLGSTMIPHEFSPLGPEWEYELDSNGKARITAYNGQNANVVIPTELDGYVVQSIAPGAFGENNTISTVSLPISIQLPAKNIFADCLNLEYVSYTFDGIRTDFGYGVKVNLNASAEPEPVDVSIDLTPGWNLVALPPGELDPYCVDELLEFGPAFRYDKSIKGFVPVSEVTGGQAYWIYSKGSRTVVIETE